MTVETSVRTKNSFSVTARRITLFLPLVVASTWPGPGGLIATAMVALSLCVIPDARKAALARGPWLRSLGIGVCGGIAIALVIGLFLDRLLAQLFGQAPDLSTFAGTRSDLSAYFRLLALGLLYGAIVEEIVFRGFFIGWGSAVLGTRAEMPLTIISAATFGLSHLYQGWTGVITTGLIGFGYGLLYVVAGRHLLVAIFAHMTVNAIGITQLYLGL